MSKELALKIAEGMPGFLWVEGCMHESGVTEAQAIEFATRYHAEMMEKYGKGFEEWWEAHDEYDYFHTKSAYQAGAASREPEVTVLREELETERLRLAACGTAALGYFNGCADKYKSASLDDVLRLKESEKSLRAENERLKADAERNSLSKLDRECLRIGQQIQRAAGDLPELWEIQIIVEKGAGTVELLNDEGHQQAFNDHCEGLSYSIEQATDAAINAARKEGE